MNYRSRRRFLTTTAGALVAVAATGRQSRSEAIDRQGLAESDARGRQFLASLFDPEVGLLPEFLGSKIYWLYHDNYLAAKVLDHSRPDLSERIRDAIRNFGATGSGKIEIVFGEAKTPLPFRHHRLIVVKRIDEKVIKTELTGDQPQTDWRAYTDLRFLAAIAQAGSARGDALRDFEAGLATWDGTGFRDRVNPDGGLYAAYKLALALLAAGKLDRLPPLAETLVERLRAVQNHDGGFVTDYNAQGRPVGEANVETTALAILALEGRAGP